MTEHRAVSGDTAEGPVPPSQPHRCHSQLLLEDPKSRGRGRVMGPAEASGTRSPSLKVCCAVTRPLEDAEAGEWAVWGNRAAWCLLCGTALSGLCPQGGLW